ncbi:MAG: hypothetical protein ABSF33_00760 [Acidimicrobiales bacterium]
MAAGSALPPPCPDRSRVVVPAPGDGPGHWAGGPSAVLDGDGTFWLAYRLRRPVGAGRGYANVVARSVDGVEFETVTVLERDEFGSDSLERPALVRAGDGTWRLYVSCATPGTSHWRVDAIMADHPSKFDPGGAVTVLPGDRDVGVKDPVIKVVDGRWHMWLCCHPLDLPDDTDRMSTRYATSDDGADWELHGVALAGTPGSWDQRAARVAEVVRRDGRWLAYYDGRASKEENAEERTGLAVGDTPGSLTAVGGCFGAWPSGRGSLRYLSMVALPDGGTRLFYETSRRDGAHDLRTEYVPPAR